MELWIATLSHPTREIPTQKCKNKMGTKLTEWVSLCMRWLELRFILLLSGLENCQQWDILPKAIRILSDGFWVSSICSRHLPMSSDIPVFKVLLFHMLVILTSTFKMLHWFYGHAHTAAASLSWYYAGFEFVLPDSSKAERRKWDRGIQERTDSEGRGILSLKCF